MEHGELVRIDVGTKCHRGREIFLVPSLGGLTGLEFGGGKL